MIMGLFQEKGEVLTLFYVYLLFYYYQKYEEVIRENDSAKKLFTLNYIRLVQTKNY